MIPVYRVVVVLLLLITIVAGAGAVTLTPIGGQAETLGEPSDVIMYLGTPYLVYFNDPEVVRLVNGTWTAVPDTPENIGANYGKVCVNGGELVFTNSYGECYAYNGTAWRQLPTATIDYVSNIASVDGTLYAIGVNYSATTDLVIRKFDGVSWEIVINEINGGEPNMVTVDGDTLYIVARNYDAAVVAQYGMSSYLSWTSPDATLTHIGGSGSADWSFDRAFNVVGGDLYISVSGPLVDNDNIHAVDRWNGTAVERVESLGGYRVSRIVPYGSGAFVLYGPYLTSANSSIAWYDGETLEYLVSMDGATEIPWIGWIDGNTLHVTLSHNPPDPTFQSYAIESSGGGTAPVANFSANATSGNAPLVVQFTDTSINSPTTWSWDFDNDGSADSAEQNPVAEYANAGTYTIVLNASNTAGNDTESKVGYIIVTAGEIALAPTANFSANVTTGTAPLVVQFSDLSTNAPTAWSWDFENDGTVDSTEQHPVCIFPEGSYTVVLNASNAAGSNTVSQVGYITVTVEEVEPITTAPSITVAPNGVAVLSETHGTTWIRWVWSPVNISTDQIVVGVFDGIEVFNLTANTTLPPSMYYRGDLNPNEYHLFGLALVNNSTGTPVVERVDLGVTTAQGTEFFYIIFIVALALALVGAIIPNRYMALVLLMFAFLLSVYLAVGTTASNASFSVIAIMMAVVTCGGMIFVMYDLVKSHVSWENDDY